MVSPRTFLPAPAGTIALLNLNITNGRLTARVVAGWMGGSPLLVHGSGGYMVEEVDYSMGDLVQVTHLDLLDADTRANLEEELHRERVRLHATAARRRAEYQEAARASIREFCDWLIRTHLTSEGPSGDLARAIDQAEAPPFRKLAEDGETVAAEGAEAALATSAWLFGQSLTLAPEHVPSPSLVEQLLRTFARERIAQAKQAAA